MLNESLAIFGDDAQLKVLLVRIFHQLLYTLYCQGLRLNTDVASILEHHSLVSILLAHMQLFREEGSITVQLKGKHKPISFHLELLNFGVETLKMRVAGDLGLQTFDLVFIFLHDFLEHSFFDSAFVHMVDLVSIFESV